MAGRRPKPTTLKLVQGNPGKRAINKREPKPSTVASDSTLPAPEHLDAVGRDAWQRMCRALANMGVLTIADGFALERLCDTYREIVAFREQLEIDGATYITTSQTGDKLIKAHPAQAMLADADRRFKSYLVEFGLTPAARSKVEVKADDDKEDPLQAYFQ